MKGEGKQSIYFVQPKDVRFLQFVDIDDRQGVSTVSTRGDDRVIVRKVEDLPDRFSVHSAHAVMPDESIVFFQFLSSRESLGKVQRGLRLTSQKTRWVLVGEALSDFVPSDFRFTGSKRELMGFLKYKI